ncbi:MAG: transketolase [Eubacteriales bacterium]
MENKQLIGLPLAELSKAIRVGSLVAIYHAGSGHPGGSLSSAELLAYLWAREMRWNAEDPEGQVRDRFVLSKGHACAALYAAAAEAGLIRRRMLLNFRKLGSPLQGHPHVLDTPWVETSTGSLGQGFSVAIGMALGLRYKGSSARVYVMLGDGELQEGEVWEGAMCAGHYKLDNLCGIVDYNKMQSDDLNKNIMGLEPLRAKWEAFNWHVVEIDGHNFEQIGFAFSEARQTKNKPTMIIAHTIKGKGVSFMEGSPLWHGSVKLRDEDLLQSLRDLETHEEEIGRYIDGAVWQ